jgi:hypothetical protein
MGHMSLHRCSYNRRTGYWIVHANSESIGCSRSHSPLACDVIRTTYVRRMTYDKVADQCVDEVDRRWRTSDPDGMTVVRRVVRTVTRQVRRRNRNGDDEESSDESLELFEKLEKQNIEDITVHPGQSSSTSWFDRLQDMPNIDNGVLVKLINLKTVEFQSQLESKKVEVESKKVEVESKRVEVEPERLRAEAERLRAEPEHLHAEAERLRAEAALVTAQTAANHCVKKRVAS